MNEHYANTYRGTAFFAFHLYREYNKVGNKQGAHACAMIVKHIVGANPETDESEAYNAIKAMA